MVQGAAIAVGRRRANHIFKIAAFVALCLTLCGPLMMMGNLLITGSQALWHTQLKLPVSTTHTTTDDSYEILQQSLNTLLPIQESPDIAQILTSLLSEAAEIQVLQQYPAPVLHVSLSAAANMVLTKKMPHWQRETYNLPLMWRSESNKLRVQGVPHGLLTIDPAHTILLMTNRGVAKVLATDKQDIILQPIMPFSGTHAPSFSVLKIPHSARGDNLSDEAVAILDALQRGGVTQQKFNTQFFTGSDSRLPEMAGILGSIWGSLLTLALCCIFCVPTGIAAAVWLEENRQKQGISRHIATIAEVNIANAASIPAVIYGLLGAAVFLNALGMPRSSPLVGGCVLSLIMLPIVITATREAIRNVPVGVKNSALALGATPLQAMLHHVLPQAFSGILTGILLGIARVAGESAPLLLVGMAAFVPGVPHNIFDASATLPTQIFLWADSPERGFVEKTAAAASVLVLLLLLIQLPLLLWRQSRRAK